MTRTFRILPESIPAARKKTLTITIPLVAVVLTISTLINSRGEKAMSGAFVLIPLLVVGGFVAYSLFGALKRQREYLESYRLIIEDNTITRLQSNMPTISIHVFEVQFIEQPDKGGFVIRGSKPQEVIYVPKYIESQEELAALLNTLHPVTPGITYTGGEKKNIAASVSAMILFFVFLALQGALIVAISGALLLALMIRNFSVLQQNPNVDNRTKAGRWVRMLPMLYVAGRVILSLLELFNGAGAFRY
jgi:hypothetical protein